MYGRASVCADLRIHQQGSLDLEKWLVNIDCVSFFRQTWWGENYVVQEHKASISFLTSKYFTCGLFYYLKGSKSADKPEGAESSIIVEYK